jgi:peptidyl-tRNA hydrolase, PTH2 family
MDVKQVIVMRKDLNMRRGKQIAQGCHASMWGILNSLYKEENGDMVKYNLQVHKKSDLPLDAWLLGDYKKICVYVNNEKELMDLCEKAKERDLPCHLQYDNGLTEFNGVKTATCCAIGPSESFMIDTITRNLPLL